MKEIELTNEKLAELETRGYVDDIVENPQIVDNIFLPYLYKEKDGEFAYRAYDLSSDGVYNEDEADYNNNCKTATLYTDRECQEVMIFENGVVIVQTSNLKYENNPVVYDAYELEEFEEFLIENYLDYEDKSVARELLEFVDKK